MKLNKDFYKGDDMATTKIWSIKTRLDHVINYIANTDKVCNSNYGLTNKELYDLHSVIEYMENDFKTENKYFVTGINCNQEDAYNQMMITKKNFNKTDGVLGYHAYQSFKGDEVTPELAHLIGVKLAEEIWGDRFEVVVATHVNTNNVHNHFCINSVSYIDGKKYYDSHETYSILRHTSDNICKEYGLNVLREKKCSKSNLNYNNFYKKYMNKNNYRSIAKEDIDRAIGQAFSYDDFVMLMEKMGYEVILRAGKISVRGENYKRNIRIERSFGEEYSLENIKRRIIEENQIRVPFIEAYKVKRPTYKRIKKYKGKKARGFIALYYHYCYILKVFPNNKRKRVSASIRADVKRMEQISKEARLLSEKKISTQEELKDYKSELQFKLSNLLNERQKSWKKRNIVNDENIKKKICNDIAELSKQITIIRNEIKLCEDIESRIPKIEENIKEFNEGKLEKRKEKNRDECIK